MQKEVLQQLLVYLIAPVSLCALLLWCGAADLRRYLAGTALAMLVYTACLFVMMSPFTETPPIMAIMWGIVMPGTFSFVFFMTEHWPTFKRCCVGVVAWSSPRLVDG